MSDNKKPLFLVDPTGKSDEDLADEIADQLRALGISVTDDEAEQQ
jgi:hypothetical protein